MRRVSVLTVFIIALGFMLIGAPDITAYQEYIDNGFGGCDNCHGAFKDNISYISQKDGADWGADLMAVHNIMVTDDCAVCHQVSAPKNGDDLIYTNSSLGGSGWDAISCIGCHGRVEDRGDANDCVDSGNPNLPCGDGVGLRQYHFRASPGFAGPICLTCHADTDPANFTPVGEDVKPPYYAVDPDPAHPDKPTDTCNANGEEDFAGTAIGLDNDGDNVFDTADPDCAPDVGPVLEIPFQEPALGGGTVTMPVTFTQNTAGDINSVAFSVDYDENNLSIDPAALMGFPWPDAISINPLFNPFFWTIEINLDELDTDGELDVVFSSSSQLVPEGELMSITFDVGNPLVVTEADVLFSLNPSPSFGDTGGASVTGTALDGSVVITPDCTPTTEVCDGVDNDCDGSIDENLTRPTTCGVGACTGNTGEETCSAGTWGNDTCDPLAGAVPEVCDGSVDENCDGTIDEGCGTDCTEGETRPTTCGIGECASNGIQSCDNGNWGTDTCTAGTPSAEVCDGLDNNCDGSIDENLTRATTCGVGACTGNTGAETCSAGTWGNDTCDPLAGAVPEVCDGSVDENCDGTIDEGCGTDCTEGETRPTTCGIGECASNGIQSCDNGNWGTDTCTAGTPSAEVCDGLDNNCDGSIDENLTRPTTCGVGACTGNTGEETCSAGTWGNDTCDPLAGAVPEVCDGSVDENCDGTIDEGCGTDCTEGETRPTTCGIGECASNGIQSCDNGNWGTDTCTAGTPSAEVCDGLDNNCDGSIDENLTRPTTCGVGACTGNTGEETCSAGTWGNDTCDPLAGAVPEVCDGSVDENCDGTIDEGCGTDCTEGETRPTTCGIGECASNGIQSCDNGNWGTDTCTAGTPSAEVCDGLDNNCDGSIDENLTRPTTCGVGACTGNTGEETCSAGTWGNDTCDPLAGAVPEVCDGSVDENCDGTIDEGCGTDCTEGETRPTTCGIGECASNGIQSCDNGNWGTDTCTAGTPSAEVCDGLDNNCDGSIDENLTRATTCGVGACTGNTGEETCSAGTWGNDTCDPLAGAVPEVCDGSVDENCDGTIDEGCGTDCTEGETRPTTCGIGECASNGIQSCDNGNWGTDTCTAGTPSAEVCDGLDNNCDGSIDENLTRATTCGVGACTGNTGEETCSAGTWGNDTCDPLAGAVPEVCDGSVDENCDGTIDEGCGTDCTEGETRPTTCGIGECASNGIQSCDNGNWGTDTCTAGTPSAEVCDGLDNNCDGSIDENLTRPTTCGVGACTGNTGEETCSAGTWGNDTCDPLAGAVPEVCDGSVDENCDGTIDEGCGTDCTEGETRPTTCGIGECASNGIQSCDNGNWGTDTCTAGTPSAEVCDGLDNNCDGSIDENLTRATTCGVGACTGNTGEETCSAGTWGNDTCDPLAGAVPEVCDGSVDENCDGTIDEGCGTDCTEGETRPTTCGIGECASNGIQSCDNGNWGTDTCTAGTPSAEVCDGLDNNCDGSIDENLTRATTCGVGACTGNTGEETCSAGTWGNDTCDPLAGAVPEVCDGSVDENCDGTIDEGCGTDCTEGETRPTTCGIGECASNGIQSCDNGNWGTDTCTAGTPSAEVCDGLDNNCDGSIDENLTRATTCGVGACTGNTGEETCSAGTWGNDTCDPLAGAVPEVCDGSVDENCDGTIDEGCGTDCTEGETRPTTCGIGECASNGIQSCDNGNWGTDTCTAGTPSAEACDNLDNDCDGSTDESLTRATTCGEGECAGNTGAETCTAGAWGGDTCDPFAGAQPEGPEGDDTCTDMADNDCDGNTDSGDSDCSGGALPYLENFESGILGAEWTANSTGEGRIQITADNSACFGNNHLTMDDTLNGGLNSLNELILTIDLSGQSGVMLGFYHKEFGDEDHLMPNVFAGSSNSDGVAISADGNVWYKVQGLTGADGIGADCTRFDIDLDAAAAAAGIAYNSTFMIKFQEYDNYSIPYDGFAFDNIEVTGQGQGVETNCFDGSDNDGDGLSDCEDPDCDGSTNGSCSTGQPGECAAGTSTCQGGAEVCVADNQPQAEVCDNLDNDCDGAVDDNLTRATTCGLGECAGNTGAETCTAGTWGGDTCDPLDGAVPEVCDGSLDEDCDGTVDEDCGCSDGATQSCGTSDVGECQLGTQTCSSGTWGACVGNIEPTAEVCDNLDNDCDGAVDDNLTRATTCGEGECAGNTGAETCTAGAWGGDTCNPLAGATAEVCDNADNDCDGSTDENLTQTTSCGVGECAGNTGTATCTAGAWGNDTCDPLAGASAEVCDNKDNDCDGSTDESLTRATTCGEGECAGNTGAETCTAGAWGGDTCDPFAGAQPEGPEGDDTCTDMADNDCDGNTDSGDSDCSGGALPYLENFESGILGAEWTANSTGEGRIQITADNSACFGNNHLTMDDTLNGGLNSLNELILTIDLSGQSGVMLGFYHKEFGDEDHLMPNVFAGSSNSDGVAISADGNVWYKVQGLTGADGIGADCTRFDIDLDAAAAAAGIAYNSTFMIKFQEYDNYSIPYDGFAFDNIEVTGQGQGVETNCFDGSDNDGDGLSDCEDPDCDGSTNGSCSTGQPGECAAGTSTCQGGAEVCVADNQPQAEVCDNLDNDCDGAVDDNLTRATTCGLGECAGNTGAETCTAGTWGGDTCDPLDGAVPEVCDGSLDEDCDGTVDEDCGCSDGATQSCGTSDVGECQLGTQTCSSGTWGACVGNIEPTAEVCDNLDNDCDGAVDDNLTRATTCGEGECAGNTGAETCTAGAWGGDTCNPLAGATAEVCDNADNDCDGSTDENLTQTTSCGVGECAGNTGTATCTAGAWGNDTCDPLAGASAEVCDNKDNDCDGSTDESLTRATTCGEGECAGNTGAETCTAGAWGGDTCDPFAGAQPEGPEGDDTCTDMADNDCDGNTDSGDSDCSGGALPYLENFESGILGAEWTANSTGEGRIQITADNSACFGNNHLTMDDTLNGGLNSLNELILTIDLSGQSGVMLGFYHKEFGDEDHLMPNVFAGSSNSDGVAISADGNVWYKVQGLTGADGIGADCTRFDIDLDAAAAAAGIAYNSTFMIKFQEYDNYSIPYDGFAFDNIEVTGQGQGVETNCFDGSDNDGDGLTDCEDPDCDGSTNGSCSTGQPGECAAGTSTCQGGAEVCVADNQPQAEVCDNLDNDCDGAVDDNLTRATTCGLGECAGNTGAETCTAGTWGGDTCDPLDGAVPEVCDGSLDEDCDGTVDEDCGCSDGATQSCGTSDVGECQLGTQTCSSGTWGACVGNIEPTAEVCDNLDNDCDGAVDDNLTRATTCGEGECAGNTGAETCTAGAWGGDTCNPLAGATAEVCDNADNDCDGSTDENLTQTTSCGVGECAGNTGTATCTAGAWGGDTCDPLAGASAEVCDNKDNDCDGSTDESLTRATTCGEGECAGNTGAETCTAGAWGGDTCDPFAGAQPEGPEGDDTCTDMADNDCDGNTDSGDSDCSGGALPYLENFESGILGAEWTANSTGEGRIQITADNSACFGNNHLTMDDTLNGGLNSLNELILTIDLSGQSGVMLGFYHKEFGDEDHLMPNVFAGSSNSDGVAISADGNVWYKVQGLTGADGIGADCTRFDIDLDAAAAAAGIAYNSTFMIKFQEYDNYSIPYDGFAFDNIEVTGQGQGVETNCFDGSDNDGDGLSDCEDPDCDGSTNGSCSTGQPGECAAGTSTCQGGAEVCVADNQPQAEVCDNLDNDCDGAVDDNLTRATTCGLGECAGNTGAETCTAGTWGGDTCDPLDGAVPEVCDGSLDEDCDGTVDEDCGCSDGATQSCGTSDVGECQLGTQTCSSGTWGACVGNIEPTAEVCDNLDNDCDGAVDDNLTRATTCGEGECAGNTGAETCTAGAWGGDTCNPLAGATAEVCDNADNDCDGSTDENLTQTTSCGVGECAGNTGTATCTAGAWGGDTCDPLDGATTETCDSLDNDCDGQVDEGGVCTQTESNCFDGMDEDNDGLTDCEDPDCDGSTNGSCSTGQPGICSTGTLTCQNGAEECAADNQPEPEICDDNLDNDCDGLSDGDDTVDCPTMSCSDYQNKNECNADMNCKWDKKNGVCNDR